MAGADSVEPNRQGIRRWIGWIVFALVLLTMASLAASASTAGAKVNRTSSYLTPRMEPFAVSPPLITANGPLQVGESLTASTGSGWNPDPNNPGISYTFTFSWQRCDVAGPGTCSNIGASGSSYTMQAADIGKYIGVKVTASVSGDMAYGDPTILWASNFPGPVTAAGGGGGGLPPTNTAPPSVSGTTAVGETLTGSPGTWSGTQPITYAYEWQRCDSAGGANCQAAASGSDQYLLVQADSEKYMRVKVTATNGVAPAGVATSSAVGPVDDGTPVNLVRPAITGTAQVGNTLNANVGTWKHQGGDEYEYQWQRCSSSFEYSTSWGQSTQSATSRFTTPFGIDVDKQGNVFVADISDGSIQKFSNSGAFIKRWVVSGGGSAGVADVDIDPSGNVWVTEFSSGRLSKFTNNGTPISQFPVTAPNSADFDSAGNLYVLGTPFGKSDTVAKWDSTGKYLLDFKVRYYAGNTGSLAVAPSGNAVYVGYGNDLGPTGYGPAIVKYSSTGEVLDEFNNYGSASIATDPSGKVYAVGTPEVFERFDSTGARLTTWTASRERANGIGSADGGREIAIDPNTGSVFTAVRANGGTSRVEKFTASSNCSDIYEYNGGQFAGWAWGTSQHAAAVNSYLLRDVDRGSTIRLRVTARRYLGGSTYRTKAVESLVTSTVIPISPGTITPVPRDPSASVDETFTFNGLGINGETFRCRLDLGAWTPCSSPQPYTNLGGGPHRFDLRRVDAAGNYSNPALMLWTIDRQAAGRPQFKKKPAKRTPSNSATFEFRGEKQARFECRLDNGPFAACSSPKTFNGLAKGRHEFRVRQIDRAGNVSQPQLWIWFIT